MNWGVPSAAIGYWCRTSFQGHGYITEAFGTLVLYAFKEIQFKRVTILCEEENTKSATIANRLGFDLETKARGILAHQRSEELLMVCRYVRFNSSGLENSYPYKLQP